MTYDDAEWHLDTVLELDLDESAAAVHIGCYLSWAAVRGLLAPEYSEVIDTVAARTSSPAALADERFVAQIDPGNLTEEGQMFTAVVYTDYLQSLDQWGAGSGETGMYGELEDSWYSYDRVVPLLDSLWEQWCAAGRPTERPPGT